MITKQQASEASKTLIQYRFQKKKKSKENTPSIEKIKNDFEYQVRLRDEIITTQQCIIDILEERIDILKSI